MQPCSLKEAVQILAVQAQVGGAVGAIRAQLGGGGGPPCVGGADPGNSGAGGRRRGGQRGGGVQILAIWAQVGGGGT